MILENMIFWHQFNSMTFIIIQLFVSIHLDCLYANHANDFAILKVDKMAPKSNELLLGNKTENVVVKMAWSIDWKFLMVKNGKEGKKKSI